MTRLKEFLEEINELNSEVIEDRDIFIRQIKEPSELFDLNQ